jgi:hypothetical protein
MNLFPVGVASGKHMAGTKWSCIPYLLNKLDDSPLYNMTVSEKTGFKTLLNLLVNPAC